MNAHVTNIPPAWIQHIQNINGSGQGATIREKFVLPDVIPEGERNGTLFRYASSLRASKVPPTMILKELKTANLSRCAPDPLSDREIESIYNSVLRFPEGTPVGEYSQGTDDIADQDGDDLRRFHNFDKKGVPTSPYDYGIFEYLCQEMNILILGGTPYLYEHGVFIPDLNGARLTTAISKLIYPRLRRSTTLDRIYRLFLKSADLQVTADELNQFPPQWINFRNGFYDPISKQMIPHDPKYRSVNQIPHDYDPSAKLTGPEIDSWLKFIAPNRQDLEMLLQYFGYCMTRDTRQQRFLILLGQGATGKSTLIRLLEKVIGLENISNISLKELMQRFASYGLVGKLLNSCADLEINALEDTSTIKKILGEDSLRAERKGCDAISFRNYARMVFSTNELPLVLSEKTNGFFRRLLVLTMNRQPEKRRADYLDILEKEIDYFIMLIVQAVERLYHDGHILESINSFRAVQVLRNESDTVQCWLSERCKLDPKAKEPRTTLYYAYKSWCQDEDRTDLKNVAFYKSLRLKDFREVTVNGVRMFEGISLNQGATGPT